MEMIPYISKYSQTKPLPAYLSPSIGISMIDYIPAAKRVKEAERKNAKNATAKCVPQPASQKETILQRGPRVDRGKAM
jgi:hypothetical protein